MTLTKFPSAIEEKIKGKSYRQEDIGRSGSAVLIFDDMVLKIEKTCDAADNEYAILSFLICNIRGTASAYSPTYARVFPR